MPDDSGEKSSQPMAWYALGQQNPETKPPTPDLPERNVFLERASLAQLLAGKRTPEEHLSRDMARLSRLTPEEFAASFQALLNRLDIPGDGLDGIFWMQLASALLAGTPEFKKSKGRPRVSGGGMSYKRYQAVVRYRRENPGTALSDIDVARVLRQHNHKLFVAHTDENLKAELSKGKVTWNAAIAKIQKPKDSNDTELL